MNRDPRRPRVRPDPGCEDEPQAGDGAQAWLGFIIAAVCALGVAAALVVALWRLAF